MPDVPNPGSNEAVKRGCICAVIDNGHGQGIGGGSVRHPESGLPLFFINVECPLHGSGDWREDDIPGAFGPGRVYNPEVFE